GIDAYNSSAGTDLTISTAVVTGDEYGIEATNDGSGALSITTTGQVTGTYEDGINALNSSAGTDLTISTAAVTGDADGIRVRNRGTGALTITTTGQVTGASADGIDADNSSAGTDLTILAAAVAAGDNGIEADNDGTGALSITTTGQVTGDDDGIRARNSSAGTNLTISTAAVTGGSDGISARNRGTGITTIAAAGAIRGGTGAGIRTEDAAGATVRVTLDAGSSVAATSGSAIIDADANASVQVNTGASVAGSISLGDGSDTLAFAGGDFSGVTLFDGGDDALAGDGFIDTLSFAGSSGTLNSALVRNFERMTISDGSNVTLSNNILMFNDGAAGNDLIINQGGTLTLASGATRLSGLSNAGRLSLSNGAVGDKAVIEGNLQSSGGTVALDAVLGGDGSVADTLNVTGDASGTTMIAIQNVGGTGAQTKDGIELVQVAGAVSGTFQLDSTAINPSGEKVITVGGYDYMLKQQSGGAFVLQSEVSRMAVSGAPAFEALGGHLLSLATLDTAFGRLATRQSGSAPTAVTRNSFSFTAALEDSVDKREIWFDFTGAQTTSSRVNSAAGIRETKADTKKLAFGRDFAIAQTGAGTFYGGVNAFFGHSDAQVVSSSGLNQIATSFKGIGASATFASGNGLYVDGQLQYTQTASDITHSGAGQLAGDITGHTWSAALEVARSFELQSDFILTPSVQLGYQKLTLPGITGPSNNAISFDENESKWAHVGARLEKTFATAGYSGSVFGTLGLKQMFDTKSSTTIAGTTFSGESGDKNVVLGLGGSIRWSARASAHASISYASGVGSFASDNSVKATIGVQMEF
ncbi:MAG: autotransporter outer membrane beta-barrel domain-containing protein, partial [Planktotalea arctica]